MKLTSYFLLFLIPISLFAQDLTLESSVSATGYLSNENNPFWFTSNNNGALSSTTDGLFDAQTKLKYSFSEKSKIELGASLFLRNGLTNELQRNQLYLQYSQSFFKITVGSKNPELKNQGLSVVNDNFLLAGNSRAIPGLIIQANEPTKLVNFLSINWGLAHYQMNDNRYVDQTMLHYKFFEMLWQLSEKNIIKAGIQHYAQWGGTSPEYGKLPNNFKDYIEVFFGRKSSNTVGSEQINALGNHLGIYNLEYHYTPTSGDFVFYHQHPFEDSSGTRLTNFPDGIWGFYFKPNRVDFTGFIDGFLVEYVDTSDQSGKRNDSRGRDNYFNSGLYRSGWTYDSNTIGLPFIYQGPTGIRIANNRVRALHFGISASHKKWSFKTKVSLVENLGTFGEPFTPKQQILYSYFQTSYTFEKLGQIILHTAIDGGDGIKDSYGIGLQYKYNFNF
ncbi:MAG: capsule assembly Wzi family protein [Flavobacteriales bacterium]